MNHDIAHCIGENRAKYPYEPCPKKDTCHRYIASQDILLPAIVDWILPMGCINENYKLYWEEKR